MNCPVCGGSLAQQQGGAVACATCGEHEVPEDLPASLAFCNVCGWRQSPPRLKPPVEEEPIDDVS